MSLPVHPVPTRPVDRIQSIDTLRGFALLGILIINVQWMSMIEGAALNPTVYAEFTGSNRWVWILSHLFAEQKFMAIFSMLFGAGIVLMTQRVEALGLPSRNVHFRRMGVLLLIGVIHAYFIWYGDILVTYALCGMVVYRFRNGSPRGLIVAGLAVLSVASIFALICGWSLPLWSRPILKDLAADWQPGAERIARDMSAYRGSYIDVWLHRVPSAFSFHTDLFLFWGLWRAGGLMVIGMGLYKLGFFGARWPRALYVRLTAAGFLVGLPIVGFGIYRNIAAGWAFEYSYFLGGQFNYWASLFVAGGWIGLVMLVCRSRRLAWVTRPLAAVGRMALTNYLMQSVICTSIFYGYGLGFYGRVERPGQLGIVLCVWALQLILSPMWLGRFRFGPVEWLWRSLAYQRVQAMRGSARASGIDESVSSGA